MININKLKILSLVLFLTLILCLAPFAFAEGGPGIEKPSGEATQGPGDMGVRNQADSINLTGVLEVINKIVNINDKTYDSNTADKSCVLVNNNGQLTLDGVTLNKAGDTSNTESSEFLGLNAAAVVQSGKLTIQNSGFSIFNQFFILGQNSKINTNANGANALFATGNNSTIEAKNLEITTQKDSSRGLDATYGGTINADNVKITTNGQHCAAVATDRGEGTVNVKNSELNTNGKGSPSIYSTGNISVSNSKGTTTQSSAAVIEGKNLINIKNCDFTTVAYGRTESGIDGTAIMIYQSMSGDASAGVGSFTSEDSTISVDSGSKLYKTAPMFFVTNTNASIDIKNTKLNYGSAILLNASGNDGEWGNSGSNGGNVVFNATSEDISGDIIVDSISSLDLNLKSSTLSTKINSNHSEGVIKIILSEDSTLKLTGDCYITSIMDEKSDFSNIESQGHNIYYNSSASSNLGGKTINLNGGGKLIPF